MPIRQMHKFRSCRSFAVFLCVACLPAFGARADASGAPTLTFGGFGTLGIVHSSEHEADFTSSNLSPNGAGHSHAWSAAPDSRIGAQVAASLTSQFSAVLQVVSEQRYDNSYVPGIEWANVKYQFTPDFSVRAGRIVVPVFLVSDYREVGYANPWVRPPVEVYNLEPIGSSDGVDASYRMHLGGLTNTVQINYGSSDTRIPAGGGIGKARSSWGVSDTAEFGNVSLHVAYHKTRLSIESFKPLLDGFRQFGADGIAIAERYDAVDKPFTFMALGGMYDPGNWFAMGEWGASDSSSAIGKRSAWYASGGYRFGKFTPYLTYARAMAKSATSDPGLNVSTLPPLLAGAAAGLNAGLNAVLGSIPVQRTISIGGRWDFAKNAALKLQFDQIRLGAGSPGTLTNLQPGFQPGGKVNVLGATIDFVF